MTAAAVDHRDPGQRLQAFFDRDTMRLLAPPDASGVLAARGDVDGTTAMAFATDATRMGGALGVEGCSRIVETIDRAVRERVPVAGLWHSAGARPAEGVAALDGVGQVVAATVRASGRVPQISVVLGPAAGGAACTAALTDIVIMSAAGRIVATGPEVGRGVTGERIDAQGPDGPEPHSRHSGVAHLTTGDDATAIARARTLVRLLGRQGRLLPEDVTARRLDALVPASTGRGYDVNPLVHALLDVPGVELHRRWAPNLVTTLGRFGGRTVGVVANNPLCLDGCLDAAGAEKGARFVRMCDALGLPLIVLVDTPGCLPGAGQEQDGLVRRGAKLLHAFAEAVVPRVTLVTRRAYGSAYIAMNSRALGATAVFAWPDAEIAAMGAVARVDVPHGGRLAATPPGERAALRERLVREHAEGAAGMDRAREIGVVDAVIAPAETRRRIAEAIVAAPAGRGGHGTIPL